MSLITLGSVDFEGFEVPARVSFGGAQKLSVHTLIGGTRVIDAMGRDDAAVMWSGTLSGPTASARARLLDGMRAAGDLQTLTWDVFSYSVVIQRLHLEFCSPWWITYALECEVQRDLAQGVTLYSPALVASIESDLANAASQLQPVLSSTIVDLSAGLMTAASGTSVAATLLGTRVSLDEMIEVSGAQLDLSDLGTITSAAESVAQLARARGYISRSISNSGELVS